MNLFTLEHSTWAYRADLALYGFASAALGIALLAASPSEQWVAYGALALAGVASWTLIEYALHRFVLHGLKPFSTWHAEHHRRPAALICAPTIVTVTLFVGLIFLPTLLISDIWRACALTFGILTGYFAYAIAHHATHHWRIDYAWVKQRKRWHALHHDATREPGYYGVTSAFWDHVFGSNHQRRRR